MYKGYLNKAKEDNLKYFSKQESPKHTNNTVEDFKYEFLDNKLSRDLLLGQS